MSTKHIARVPSVPLITHDPHFSAWSPADSLYEKDVEHWSGAAHRMNGHTIIDGEPYRFLGKDGPSRTMEQKELVISATSSMYRFEAAGVSLEVKFTSPLLLSDLELVSRPCTYVDFKLSAMDSAQHEVAIHFEMDDSFCHDFTEKQPMIGGVHIVKSMGNSPDKNEKCAWMGLRKQTPLGNSGDAIRINWGYLYVYASCGSVEYIDDETQAKLCADFRMTVGHSTESTAYVAVAYDDLQSINYFGESKKALWADKGETALQMLDKAIDQHDSILTRCKVFDAQLASDANAIAGQEYVMICNLAYRQSIASHKLIRDSDGRIIFLSKECHSNGCIGTVDVSYPSTPLYLLYNPELVMGMIRPVIKFAKLPCWGYDFAPHDVGRYPYATGQVYGLKDYQNIDRGDIFPPYYIYPDSSDIYEHKYQMPVEECGNMLIMIAAVAWACCDHSYLQEFIDDMPLLEKWAAYLVKHGNDPKEQLCTDDFAGHLAHNVNLSAKAIMGVAAMGIIKIAVGQTQEGQAFLSEAKSMALAWEDKFKGRGHSPLIFTDPDSWGLKYNLVWDLVFDLELFDEETYKREIKTYLTKRNKYGMPLDNRKDYTKSDWILWCATMADNYEDRHALISPVYDFLRDSPGRVPFSDWYDTVTGEHINFKNRTVQGGLFMPLLKAISKQSPKDRFFKTYLKNIAIIR